MEISSMFADKSDEEINLSKLQDIFKSKVDDIEMTFQEKKLKKSTMEFFSRIIKPFLVTNPAEIEIY